MGKTKVVKIDLKEHGFSGYAARPEHGSKRGVVIIMGGESVILPFLKLGRAMAKVFAGRGFTAVSVSLFGAEGLGDSPDRIPLEYTLNAIKYLKQAEGCGSISVFGMSMGSIFALGSAIYSDAVDNLIMMSPSHAAFEAVSKDRKTLLGRSAMTFHGRDIPYVSADFRKYKMYEAYQNAYLNHVREAQAMAALPIEKACARVLLLAGEKDGSWPSAYSVRLLYERLQKADYCYAFEKMIYPGYGHMLPLKKDAMQEVFDFISED